MRGCQGSSQSARTPSQTGAAWGLSQKLSQIVRQGKQESNLPPVIQESAAERRPQPRSPVCQDPVSLSLLHLSALSRPRATISAHIPPPSDPRRGTPAAESRVPSSFLLLGSSSPARPPRRRSALPSTQQASECRREGQSPQATSLSRGLISRHGWLRLLVGGL